MHAHKHEFIYTRSHVQRPLPSFPTLVAAISVKLETRLVYILHDAISIASSTVARTYRALGGNEIASSPCTTLKSLSLVKC